MNPNAWTKSGNLYSRCSFSFAICQPAELRNHIGPISSSVSFSGCMSLLYERARQQGDLAGDLVRVTYGDLRAG